MSEGEKKRARISATELIGHARDRKKAEVARLQLRADSLADQLGVVNVELEAARGELAQLQSALPAELSKA